MRKRSIVSPFFVASIAAIASVACGGVQFGTASDGGGSAPDEDAGAEGGTITIGPPDSSIAPDDATTPQQPDAASDASAEGSSGSDGSVTTDAAEPVDAAPPPDAAPACAAGYKVCGSGCVADTNPDTGCAGASCAACDLPEATAVCGATGACAIGSCATGFADCDSNPVNGCETNITTASNCGKCGTICPAADPDCVAGTSGYSCSDNCPAATPTLCGTTCVDEATDPNHCGSCTTVCSGAGANATNQCVSSECQVVCDANYTSCNGACVDYANDNNDCGSCGHACATVANGSDSCVSSSCTVACNPGYQLCTVSGASTCVAPNTTQGVFVSTSSSATTGCGSIAAPCGTIAAGIAVAKEQGLTIMYLDAGTYAEQVTLINGLTIEGGWLYKGAGVWDAQCGGTTNPSTLAVIQPTSIASGPAATVLANGVTATLSTLTVKSLATAAASQSLYGVFASNGAKLTMNAVDVTVAAGGAGTAGGLGTATSGPTNCNAAPQDGKAGAAVANGTPVAATYSSAGYTPGTGGSGSPGNPGDNGTAPTVAPGCDDSSRCAIGDTMCSAPTSVCGTAGSSGCGGAGGPPGTGGSGGGASIGVLSWGATVTITGGSLTAGDGGNGGAGGGAGGATAAPPTWTNMDGTPGQGTSYYDCSTNTVCTTVCHPVCTDGVLGTASAGGAGGNGGIGSAGGLGASGSGGDSYAYYAPTAGAGTIAVSGATVACGSPGTSPSPVPGAAGSNGSNSCY